jgi:hypothetical protein
MQISNVGAAHIPVSAGKSKGVPPGLQRRELDLPPGITKKLEAEGTAPRGIVSRFPAPVAPSETASEPGTSSQPGEGPPTVDIVV